MDLAFALPPGPTGVAAAVASGETATQKAFPPAEHIVKRPPAVEAAASYVLPRAVRAGLALSVASLVASAAKSKRLTRAARRLANSASSSRRIVRHAFGGAFGGGQSSAKEVITNMYAAVNAKDIETAMQYVDPDVVYEDFNFPEPFKGDEAVRRLFKESAEEVPGGLLFVIDEVSDGDGLSCGVTWHVELDGIPFPNGRGVSLYRISPDSRKLVYARDCVEPATKPGAAAFGILRAVAPLLRAVGPSWSKIDAPAFAFFLIFSITYWCVLLLSPPGLWSWMPGEPAWAISQKTIDGIVADSFNFFFIPNFLTPIGIDIGAPSVDPVRLGFFNFCEAFDFLLLPLLLFDRQRRGGDQATMPDTLVTWSVAMFGTNAILGPYMATRALSPLPDKAPEATKPWWTPAWTIVGLLAGLYSIYHGFFAPGADPDRIAALQTLLANDRVMLAFGVDVLCFSALQAYLMSFVEGPGWRYVPFLGLAGWLLL
eukprot:TRINITY_DN7133_c0_g2_i3.p1 TRINITY_DN7133_c0_g2~~TRINITY_DN7133_c0_g2_i3.p1  ORF type:complete len:485 (-),score=89.13 TRINITY_DN7133_c0_g2_i3:251-1705(-)